MKAFSTSQFGYCPLIRMCCSRINSRKINSLYDRCLRIIYQDKQSSFEQLLKKDNSVSVYQGNLQSLVTRTYKMSSGLSHPDTGIIEAK